MSLPLVTVITPAYNAAKFLPRVIATVRCQDDVLYEHIIVDDGSTDGSFDLLKEYARSDERIRLIRLEKNMGVVNARNEAIRAASGRFLAFLDADDEWMPQKLSVQISFMQHTDASITFSDYRFISESGHLIGRRLSGPSSIGWHLHHMTRYLGCLTIVIDRSKFPDFSFGEISANYRAEDFLAWSIAIKKNGKVLRCPYDLARYSVVHDSRSSDAIRAAKSVWKLYRHEEKISLFLSTLYFFSYISFATFKRYFYRPIYNRGEIDKYCHINVL